MIDGAKHEIEGVYHDIYGAKCQVVKYFVVSSSQIKSFLAMSSQEGSIEIVSL